MNEWTDIAVIAPTRDIDLATASDVHKQIDDLVASGVRRVIINCQNVAFIDSTGLACLLSCARDLSRHGGVLSLNNVSAHVVRFLQITRLLDALHVSSLEKPVIPRLSPDTPPRMSKCFSICAGVENLACYRHRIEELLHALPLSAEECFDMALAAGEALSNAYDHAHGAAGSTLSLTAFDDRVVIEVNDCGEGYAIEDTEDVPTQLERGRGIRLMRMLADSVEVCRRVDAQGTCVRLIKLL